MRSTVAADYQHVPRPVAAMAKAFDAASTTGWHSHVRAQLLYASAGLMTANTAHGTWFVPSGHALLIPPGTQHDVTMHGAVAMRTAYLTPAALPALTFCKVLRISPLLDASLAALAEEPVLYDESGRGGHLAALVLDEIARAPETPFALPLPQDARLRRLCEALIADPGLDHDIDGWAETIGMSRRTLTRHFRDETALSFGAWRRRLRLLSALTRQAEGASLPQIARGVGYGDPRALQAMMRRTAQVLERTQ